MPEPRAATTQDPLGLEGTTLRERFRLEARVARGGFGYVYRATDLTLKSPAAVKVLHVDDKSLDPEALARELREEAQRQACLEHPAVARVIDLGVTTTPSGLTCPWMALEWVEGRTLAEELRERSGRGGRPPADCMELLRPIFEAVAEAHERGIVHRDIKPGNIMRVAASGSARRRNVRPPVRLLDFGIAKVMAPDEQRPPKGDTDTRSGASAFSLRYASPEQLGRMRTGPWTDVHALALVLTQMLTDREPFPGDNEMAVMSRVLDDQRPTPARFSVDVGALEPVLARALAKNHAERYPDAGAFLDAIDAAMGLPRRSVPPPASAHDRSESPTERPSDPEVVLGDAHTVAPFRTESPVTSSGARPVPPSPRRGARIGVVVAAATASILLVFALWSRSMKPPPAPGRLHDASVDATTSTLVPTVAAPEASVAAPPTTEATTTDAATPSAHRDGPTPSSRADRPRPHPRTPRDASVTVAPPRPTTEPSPAATVDAGRTPRFDPGRLKMTFASPPKENR